AMRELGVAPRDLRADGDQMPEELRVELRDEIGERRGKVPAFARVVAQVVELERRTFVPADELPVAVTNDRVGRHLAALTVVGKVPVERATPEGGLSASSQMLDERSTVDLFLRRADAGRVDDRRIPIDGRDRLVRNGARGDHARPAHDRGNADAAFIRIALSRAERAIVGRSEKSTVVRGEDDERALREAVL